MNRIESKFGADYVPLVEHPTPQFQRKEFLILNGWWDFQITNSMKSPDRFEEKILVPFSVETPLSGIQKLISKEECLHYRRSFTLPKSFAGMSAILHFDGVDQECDVWLNGNKVYEHVGGYLPFSVKVDNLPEQNVLEINVRDDTDSEIYPRGKQSNEYGGIFYKPTSGIWKSVWIEPVPREYASSIRFTPDFDGKAIDIAVSFNGSIKESSVAVLFKNQPICEAKLDSNGKTRIDLKDAFHPWSPEQPNLYEVTLKINEDEIHSYFAMRKFSMVEYKGRKVFGLNNKPYFLTGLLDQGYWHDGGLTAPSDQALIDDIETIKSMGFNMLRKHIKIEPMRWYYHCDRLGVIVIQDFVNGGSRYKKFLINTAPFISYKFNDLKHYKLFGRGNSESRKRFEDDMQPTVELLFNSPCLAIWTLFNEGWGQFDAIRLTSKLKALDPTRLVDSTSGWYDQHTGDFESRHIYFRAVKLKPVQDRILSLTEFGGYALATPNHMYRNKKSFGYKSIKSQSDLEAALKKLYEQQIAPLIEKAGLSIAVYTQLSDVEDEVNGLVTYDRQVVKINPEVMAALNGRLKFDEQI